MGPSPLLRATRWLCAILLRLSSLKEWPKMKESPKSPNPTKLLNLSHQNEKWFKNTTIHLLK
jgi:hypothetical protein